jgi:ribose-phosphate pyrophosphokinase
MSRRRQPQPGSWPRLLFSQHAGIRIQAFADTERFAKQLARAAGIGFAHVHGHSFPDSESLVRIRSPAGEYAVLVRSLHDPNAKLVEPLLAADALCRTDTQCVILVAPYLPSMRQDTRFAPGEPISPQVIGGCLSGAFDGVLTVDAHLRRVAQLSEVVPGSTPSLAAAPAIAQGMRSRSHECTQSPMRRTSPGSAVGRSVLETGQ